jgi:hypothetical protein
MLCKENISKGLESLVDSELLFVFREFTRKMVVQPDIPSKSPQQLASPSRSRQ